MRINEVQVPNFPVQKTFYTQNGELFAEGCSVLALLFIIPRLRRRNR
jgi:hypothetical protein